jgi:putative sigma-54 modulation protein
MDIIIQAEDGLKLTEDLRVAIEEKIGRVEHFAPRAIRARVRLRKASAHARIGQYVVRVLVELPGNDISAEQIGPEPLLALDILTDKLTRRLEKRKTERMARRHARTERARAKA